MGGFTLIFVSLLVYLSLKGRLSTYVTLATTSSTTPKSNNPPAGSQQPNEAGKGDLGTGAPSAPTAPPAAGTGTSRGVGTGTSTGAPLDPTPFDFTQLIRPYASEIISLNALSNLQHLYSPWFAAVGGGGQ